MQIFVGTLYTIENEFEECVTSIERQSYRNFQHFIFRDLRNKEAHDTLYKAFMERSDDFDLLIKVDADMVIENENLFTKIIDKFRINGWLKDLEIAVYDFFSDHLIWGMHTYRNTVRWQHDDKNLFVDACPVEPHERLHDDNELAPAAIHCKDPSPYQSFHYGVHRALKVIQPGQSEFLKGDSLYHWDNLKRTVQNFSRTGDRRIGLAVLGAELVFRGGIQPHHLDYSDPHLRKLFKRYENLDADQLQEKIKRVTRGSFGFLPTALRWRALVQAARCRFLLSGNCGR
jgi:hypothetical protein